MDPETQLTGVAVESHEGRERLTKFLYLLMRDAQPTGEVARLVKEVEWVPPHKDCHCGECVDRPVVYTAKGLEVYARELASRILNSQAPPIFQEENYREEILATARDLTKLPVEWTSARTTQGDVPNRGWTLEVFDVPYSAELAVRKTLRPLFARALADWNINLSLITHNVTNTTQFYPWVREGKK
jgi:hypothetical protein